MSELCELPSWKPWNKTITPHLTRCSDNKAARAQANNNGFLRLWSVNHNYVLLDVSPANCVVPVWKIAPYWRFHDIQTKMTSRNKKAENLPSIRNLCDNRFLKFFESNRYNYNIFPCKIHYRPGHQCSRRSFRQGVTSGKGSGFDGATIYFRGDRKHTNRLRILPRRWEKP